ncbi:MAG: glycosyltransferase family 4 protein, partial [Rhodothermales bacterium]|nr:glycosyltransferase family 4 protein [Rhodothermales bacterium]
MMPDTNVVVVGRIPPPVDGQSLLTGRLVQILGSAFDTTVVNTNTNKRKLSKVRHYHQIGLEIESAVREVHDPVVVWPSISPHPISHFRDMSTVIKRCGSSPIIAVIHWGNFDRLFLSPITKITASKIVERVSRFVFNDSLLAEACRPWIPDHKIATINNPLDPEVVSSRDDVLSRISQGPSNPFRILYLSNMIRTKGYLDVLAATHLLAASGKNIVADFVGAWHENRAAFDSMVVDNRLDNSVVHHGLVKDRNTIRGLLLAADAFVLPTYYPTEAQPSALIEALAAGTPVITSDQGGITEMVISGRDAIFVPAKRPDKIVDAIVELMNPDVWTRFATNARER